jgi:hypothetical protein
MGGLMLLIWSIRFFLFKLYESPKYLMGRGRDEDAVEVMHIVASYNRTTSMLTVEQLKAGGSSAGEKVSDGKGLDTSAKGALRRQLDKMSPAHVKALFATKKLAWSTSLLIIIWGMCKIQVFLLLYMNMSS